MAKKRITPRRKKIKQPEEKKREAPSYMMSFGDMMTLMLTFFILLCTLASEQQAGLVAAGTGSFVRALDAFGLPGLLPKSRNVISLGRIRPQFLLPREQAQRKGKKQIDEERIIKPEPKRVDGADITYFHKKPEITIPLDISFERGLATLPASAKPALDNIVKLIRGKPYSVIVKAYVDSEEQPSKPNNRGDRVTSKVRGWMLSAERAASVARYFIAAGHVTADKISIVGYGEFRPIVDAASGQRQANDRIIVVLSKHK